MASPSYPKTSVNKLGRLANRVHALINQCPILHVSFNDPEHTFPVVLPMLGCTGNFGEQDADASSSEQDVYIHGYVSGRVFKSGKEAGEQGLPITIAASLVTDKTEALYAMQKITDNLLPQRWAKSRTPPTPAELTSTSILRVKIASASAKIRVGGPSEDRADLKDKEVGETGRAKAYAFEAVEMDGKKKK
ncbi:hypothetical protein N0V83_010955 [Neocucurbitaria cava]|uniref:Uncharacterized protein n=1 Tax=Neocucurbitaria cava TaxID=798079 RepID=A0A9W8XX95_9PLEO|nr:hypothetical protein N0V83_010955 [Neocucurbitaria cava]